MEEMYKRTLQEVGSLREQLGGWVVNVSAQSWLVLIVGNNFSDLGIGKFSYLQCMYL